MKVFNAGPAEYGLIHVVLLSEMYVMQTIHPDIDRSDIRVDPEDILRLLGGREEAADAHAASLVHQYIGECSKIMSPSAAYLMIRALDTHSKEHIAIKGMEFQTGTIVHNMLRYSERFAFFLVTVGPEIENRVRTLLEQGNYLEGYIMDLVASSAVEALAEVVHGRIREAADSGGMKVTNRYSPGYCSWDVSEQQKLFTLFPDQCCGITLSDSSLMTPVKSASGVIGVGGRVKFNGYTCEICPMKHCGFKKPRV